MTDIPTTQPPQYIPEQPAPRRGNGFGITSLILGIVALAGFAIPFLNYVTIFVGAAGVVFGIIGLIVKFRPRKAATAGLILSGLGLILSIILAVVYTAAFAGAAKSLNDDSAPAVTTQPSASSPAAPASSAPAATGHTVTYDVTGNGTKATDVTYLTFNNGSSGTSQANDAVIPFHKVIPIESNSLLSTSIFSLVAQASDGSSITCNITVDGKVISTNTSTGPYAVATCSGSN